MKLIAHYNKYCRATLYSNGEMYVMKVRKEDTAKYTTSLYNWLIKEIGPPKSIYLIREESEVYVNGYAETLKDIPTDYRDYNLIILKK